MTRLWAGSAVVSHPQFDLRWVSGVALSTAIGLRYVAAADAGSREGNDATYRFFGSACSSSSFPSLSERSGSTLIDANGCCSFFFSAWLSISSRCWVLPMPSL